MKRATSIYDLISTFRPGERVFVPGSSGEPRAITSAISESADVAEGVEFVCSFIPGVNRFNLASSNSRKMHVFFMQPQYEASLRQGCITFSPLTYHNLVQSLSKSNAVDSVVLQVSPPNAEGFCSLGPYSEFVPPMLKRNPRLLAVINDKVPNVPDAPKLSVEQFELIVECDENLATYDSGKSNTVTTQIAEHVAGLIPNGATVQCGIGKIPNQLMQVLGSHRGLRIHSGMISDGIRHLIESNALDSDYPIVSAVALGSPDFYSSLPDIQNLRICGVDYTHSESGLAATKKLRAINSALEVDLLGQVNAEYLDGQYVSGPGGLPDFATAARLQDDGLSIIALPSTNPDGTRSRIVSHFAAGTPVTVPHYNVDALVTEYGVALLRGTDLRTRAERIISVAHPDHREMLERSFRSLSSNAR